MAKKKQNPTMAEGIKPGESGILSVSKMPEPGNYTANFSDGELVITLQKGDAKNKHIVNASGGTINDEDFLKAEIASGVSFENPEYLRLFDHTLQEVLKHMDFTTFCDLGTGIGVFPHVVAESDRHAVGYDMNGYHERYFKRHGNVAVSFRIADFTEGIVGHYDLLACIEVAEHIPDEKLLPFLATLHNHGKALLFSSTSERTDNDAGWGHINIKEQSEWVTLFEGFGWSLKATMDKPNHWTKLFVYNG